MIQVQFRVQENKGKTFVEWDAFTRDDTNEMEAFIGKELRKSLIRRIKTLGKKYNWNLTTLKTDPRNIKL